MVQSKNYDYKNFDFCFYLKKFTSCNPICVFRNNELYIHSNFENYKPIAKSCNILYFEIFFHFISYSAMGCNQ
jgi:hypothetical protein